MKKNKLKFTFMIITIVVILVLGRSIMMNKKIVKEEGFDLSGIQNISINANIADINISFTDSDEIKITQYSRKRVEASLQYETKVEGNTLFIIDYSRQVEYFLGLKGSPGISYEIQLPKIYVGSLNIVVNNGNIDLKAVDGTFDNLNIDLLDSGDITMETLSINSNSSIKTKRGNIDVTLSSDADCKVIADTGFGNISVAEKYSSGLNELVITNRAGDIEVK